MDAYLAIAEQVLRDAREPLTSRQILRRAYILDIVPRRLFGTTQHKTLGARLSVDIIRNRERSVFFRTAPGKFFLREFLTDVTIPAKYRTPMIARRRVRELYRGPTLAMNNRVLATSDPDGLIEARDVQEAIDAGAYQYADVDPNETGCGSEDLTVWSFVVVLKGTMALTYRQGKYREDRDVFMMRRSVGFYAPVAERDSDLFSQCDRGIVAAGIEAVALDLDLPWSVGLRTEYEEMSSLRGFVVDPPGETPRHLLGVITFECPEWLEPLGKRLAINDLQWLDLNAKVNHVEAFDPWSRRLLELWGRMAPATGGGVWRDDDTFPTRKRHTLPT